MYNVDHKEEGHGGTMSSLKLARLGVSAVMNTRRAATWNKVLFLLVLEESTSIPRVPMRGVWVCTRSNYLKF